MKADFIERMALANGCSGWFMIFWSAGIGSIGGLIIGAMAAGAVSSTRHVEPEADSVSGWVIVGFALLGFILTGNWCRRRLIRLRTSREKS